MKVLSKDYYELDQLKKYVSDGKTFKVEDLKKENVGQAILDNKYFHDFDLDGVITYNDYLIAWNWVAQGKPTDIREFVRDRGAAPAARKLPYQYIQDKSYDSVSVTGLPPDNRIPPEVDSASTEISADWDADGEIDELESKILEQFILSRPKTVEEYNRNRGRYPITKKLPDLLTAKYLPDNLKEVDWNDLIVFNEWLRQDKPKTFKEFNRDSVEGMDFGGDQYTTAELLIEGGVKIPITLGTEFPPVRAMYLLLDEDAGEFLIARLNYASPLAGQEPLKRISGVGLGTALGSPEYAVFRAENAFDDRTPVPFWPGMESGSLMGSWITYQAYLPYVWIQYQFANNESQMVTEYSLMATFASPPKTWVLQGANAADLFADSLQSGGSAYTGKGWTTVDEVKEEYQLPPGRLVSGSGKGIATGSYSYRFGPELAFDGSLTTRFRGLQSELPYAYLQFSFNRGARERVTQYQLTSWNKADTYSPKTWKLQGINIETMFSGGTWADLDVQTDQTNWGILETREFVLDEPDSYEFYRLLISEVDGIGENTDYFQITEFKLLEEGSGEKLIVDWARGTTRHYVVDTPGDFQYYRFIFSSAYDDEELMGLHEIELYGKAPTHTLVKQSNANTLDGSYDGMHYYALSYDMITMVTLDGLLPPSPYESLGVDAASFEDVYVGAENL